MVFLKFAPHLAIIISNIYLRVLIIFYDKLFRKLIRKSGDLGQPWVLEAELPVHIGFSQEQRMAVAFSFSNQLQSSAPQKSEPSIEQYLILIIERGPRTSGYLKRKTQLTFDIPRWLPPRCRQVSCVIGVSSNELINLRSPSESVRILIFVVKQEPIKRPGWCESHRLKTFLLMRQTGEPFPFQ